MKLQKKTTREYLKLMNIKLVKIKIRMISRICLKLNRKKREQWVIRSETFVQ